MTSANTNQHFQFFVTAMPSTRPADYYLGCLEGAVYMDFNDDSNGRIRLVRISFDGYGCCTLGMKSIPMSQEDSLQFKQIVESQERLEEDIRDQIPLTLIVKKTITNNKKLIWEDALKEYDLI